MPILTTEQQTQLAVLLAQAPYVGQTQAAMLDLLNTVGSIANPTPQGTVPVPFNLAGIVSACSTGGRAGLASFLAAATPLIIAQDAAHIADGLDGLVLLGAVSEADATAIKSVLFATTPDPAWPATVEGPTPFQGLFPGVAFAHADGSMTNGTATADMIADVLG